MKNQASKTSVTKKAIKAITATNKKETVVKEKKVVSKPSIINLNLSKYADKLKSIEVKEKKSKDSFYKYPESFTQLDINSLKGKQFRNKMRNKINSFENNIFVFAKTKQIEKLKNEVRLFNDFYKEHYQINDYSLKSITQAHSELKTDSLQMMLNIIKDVNNAK